MILFKKVRYKNFLMTGNIFTEIELDKAGTTLIVGKNGVGKTTTLDAITFALFNEPFRDVNLPQLVNSITKKNMLVEIEFSVGSNEYKVVRGRLPNVFQVFENGVLLNQDAKRDYQKTLENQILKINFKAFCQIVVLGGRDFKFFMRLTAGERRAIIEDLLDLQIFSTMNVILKSKIDENGKKLKKILDEKTNLEEKLAIIRRHMNELQTSNEQIIAEKNNLITETEWAIKWQQSNRLTYEANISVLESQIENEDTLTNQLKKLSSLRYKIEANLNNLNSDVEFFKVHDDCPTCKQPIDKQFKCDTLNKKQNEISEINKGLELLIKKYDATEARIKKIMEVKSEINENNRKISNIDAEIRSLNSYITRVRADIVNINKSVSTQDVSLLKEYEERMVAIEVEYNELMDDKQTFAAAALMLKDGGIKSKIIKQYIPVINSYINSYLDSMDFMCQFELSETFSETIKSRNRDAFTYGSFSGGQKMRIDLAILFAWRAVAKLRNSVNTNLLIMDEVFDSALDVEGTDDFIKIINTLTKDTNTIIISHKVDQLQDKFDRVIKIVNNKNFSQIAEDI